MKLISVLLVSLLIPGTVFAQWCENPSQCVIPIGQGQITPFGGQLLTDATAQEIANRMQRCETRLKTEVEEAARVAALKSVELCNEKLNAMKNVYNQKAGEWAQRNALMERQASYYEREYDGTTGYVVLTAILSLGIGFGAGYLVGR